VIRPWLVRAVALLLVLVGLQAGSFRDLDTGDAPYYGTADYGAVVAVEARLADGLPPPAPVARLPQAQHGDGALPTEPVRAAARAFHLPDPTGPPRA
jgi:hypothetical protein